ncbi:MAG TPA: pyridoxine 5'-phosphate synthase, partial [Gemmatimonadaceae bacterium]|nr:pyridoxine 5'-phosphate synthase [Gemmatimonadaceae bacterium]
FSSVSPWPACTASPWPAAWPAASRSARRCRGFAVELHTGTYCHSPANPRHLLALRDAAAHAAGHGLAVHAGHGLTLENVGPVAAIAECEELNIGHAIIAHAVFVGLPAAVRAMRIAMDMARAHDAAVHSGAHRRHG